MSAQQISAAHFVREVQKRIDRSKVAIRSDIAEDGFASHLVSARIGISIYLQPDAVDQYFGLISVNKAG